MRSSCKDQQGRGRWHGREGRQARLNVERSEGLRRTGDPGGAAEAEGQQGPWREERT